MFLKSFINKILFSTFLITITFVEVQAQEFMFYKFELPTAKVSNSLYNKIKLIDRRLDTATLGKLGNKDILIREPLADELNNILSALVDGNAKSQQLLFQLRAMSFGLAMKTFSGK